MSLINQAKNILRKNDLNGKLTRASPKHYPYSWLWDSCFIAIGYSNFDIERAKNEILGLLERQWENGMLPHINFKGFEMKEHFRRVWGNSPSSWITQPPVISIAAWEIYKKDKDKEFLKQAFSGLKKYHNFLHRERGGSLLFIIHSWESGLDNLPLYDEIYDRLRGREYFDKLESQRKRNLVKFLRKCGWNVCKIKKRSPFLVNDVLVNSIWCEANQCLEKIGKVIGKDVKKFQKIASMTKKLMQKRLFNGGYFFDYDLREKRLIKKMSCVSLMPLVGKVATKNQAKTIVRLLKNLKNYGIKYPIPSYHPKEKEFCYTCYWRGPTWININWLLIRGLRDYGYNALARELKEKTISLVKKSGFREYFNPKNGKGCGASDFSWSAALIIDIMKK